VLFCALGRPPLGPQDLAGVGGVLGGAVAACLSPDPAGRPTALTVLAQLLGRHDLPAPAPAASPPSARPLPSAAPPPAATPPPTASALPAATPAVTAASLLAQGAELARGAARGPITGPVTSAAAGPGTGAAAGPVDSPAAGLGGPTGGAGTAGEQHSRPDVPAGRSARTRRLLWGTAAAACVLALVAGVAAIVRQQTGSPGRPVPPATLAGSWSGPVHQTHPALTVTVRISLPARLADGTITYPALHCSGTLAIIAAAPGQLTVHQTIRAGQRTCRDGDFTLAAGPAGTATFSFQRTGDGHTSGILTRPGKPAS
jgi:hypothetical protein